MTVYRRNPLLMTVMGANPGPRARKPDAALDRAIEQAWYRLMSGVQVPILSIPKIFRDVKLEMAAGVPLEQAVISVGAQYRVNRNPLGEAIVAGAAGALINRAFQSNPGPSFVVIDSQNGSVMYTKRATGVGSEAIRKCAAAARRLAQKYGHSFIVYLDLQGVRIGHQVSVPVIRMMGITEEVFPDGSVGMRSNPHLENSPCPTCSGSLAYQGTLGNREHYRCRNCGLDFNTPITRAHRRRWISKTCGHGEITGRCVVCRGRRVSSEVKPCPHGISGGGAKCLACQRLYRRGGPVQNNPAIARSWDGLKARPRLAILEFAGIPFEQAKRLAVRSWGMLPPDIRSEVSKGWQENPKYRVRYMSPGMESREEVIRAHGLKSALKKAHGRSEKLPPQFTAPRSSVEVERYRENPGPRGKRRMTVTVEQFARWVKRKNNPKMWRAFLAKFKGYEKWTHGARARKVHLEWVDTPGVDGLWITYDGGKQPESTYIMPKGSPRKGAWKHPWDTMPDIKHDPQAGIVITKLRGQSKITDFYHK